ncbi:InlB B-repeat-containing protein [Methanomethylophilus alvi]|uniref:InlB B-repeat-containing protein n=1 Tax=Methanomethylophilus alvi TaxID=1291540 RepID=UPI0037DD43AB
MSRTGSACRRSGYAKKMAAIAVALMSVAVIWTVLSEESEATGDDYTRYYYDQLDQMGKAVYDKALTLEPGESSFDIALNMDWFDDDSVTNVKNTLSSTLSEIRMALVSEKPELYWMGTGLEYELSYHPSGDIVTGGTITYSFPTAFSTNSEEKTAFDQAVANFHIDDTNRYTAVKSIHDGLASTLSYSSADNEENSSVIRSAYTALAGDHNVVCEGYAKSFKLLCDRYGIPCITVTGGAKGSSSDTPEGHMWNYVMMDDGKWYLVDCTWDDQTTTIYNYMLAGSNTMGMLTSSGPAITVGESHDPSTVSDMFSIPTLASDTYSPPSYTVSFETNGGDAIQPVMKNEDDVIILEEPSWSGHAFKGWYTDPGFGGTKYAARAEYTVTGDVTFYAQWVDVYNIYFKADGRTVKTIQFESVTDTVTEPAVPPKAGYTGVWEAYTLILDNVTVNAVYTPITYTAAFVIDGVTVSTVEFTVEDKSLPEPEIPPKEGYKASWEKYRIGPNDLTIHAVYTEEGVVDKVLGYVEDMDPKILGAVGIVIILAIIGLAVRHRH